MRTNTGQILYIPKIGQRADFQHPLMRGCVGWWPLTDGGGGIAKDLVSGNNGIQNGGVTWTDTELGRTASFDGTFNQRFNISTGYDFSTGTVAGWFYADSSTSSGVGLVGNGSAVNDYDWMAYLTTNGTSFRFYKKNSAGTAESTTGVTVSVNEWHQFVITKTGTSLEVYIDGVLLELLTLSDAAIRNTFNFKINAVWTQTSITGNIQNVRVWNCALSSSEALELYQNPWAGLSIPSETRYFYFPTTLPLSETIGTFKMRNLSFAPKSGGRTIIRKPS